MILLAPFAIGLPLVGLLFLALMTGWLGGGVSTLGDTWSSGLGKILGAGVAVVAIVVGGTVIAVSMGLLHQGSVAYRLADALASTLERLVEWSTGFVSGLLDPLIGLLGGGR